MSLRLVPGSLAWLMKTPLCVLPACVLEKAARPTATGRHTGGVLK
jgi:hypothetical protein